MARPLFLPLVWSLLLCFSVELRANIPLFPGDSTPIDEPAPSCFAPRSFRDTWIKVAERSCIRCHVQGGEADESKFLLIDTSRIPIAERGIAMVKNCSAWFSMASTREQDGRSRLMVKATGGLDHGGGIVLKADSTELRLLQSYVDSLSTEEAASVEDRAILRNLLADQDPASLFDGVVMISDQRLLRRLTLSLVGRLPTTHERESLESNGSSELKPLLAKMMTEEAFLQRLVEGFNDIFLARGYEGNGEDVLAYNHFEKTRHWYQKHDLSQFPEAERQKARYKLADQYREALRREPYELIKYIVKGDRPFTEILTADFTLVSPYTARGYGIYDELRDQFQNPEDPFEFIPAKLKALKHRDGKIQPTADGVYPHAGLLSMFQYLRRFPTTETNRNRLRSRMYYQHFLGVDIMNLAPRVSDAAAIDAKYKIPTMQAAECVVCHRTIDPIAGLFQDYYNEEGHYGPRKAGWFTDMFEPGREEVDLPESDRWRALQWLGQQTVKDPRFAIAMTEHVYYILMGRKPLAAPDDIDAQHFAAKRQAYIAQRELMKTAADHFAQENFNLKLLFEDLALSPFYRADGVLAADHQPEALALLDDIGLVRLLSPEQIERKIVAVFGKRWGRLTESYEILYGGIDSKEVTERLPEPSGAIGAIQRVLANEVACKNVSADFALPAAERRLFPTIEINDIPSKDDLESESKIRRAIVHLHQHVLGQDVSQDDVEVTQTYQLFTQILQEAAAREKLDRVESYFCKSSGQEGPRDPDPHYTLRAWRAVLTYLLRQHDFLYE